MANSEAAHAAALLAQRLDLQVLAEILALKKQQRELAARHASEIAALEYRISEVVAKTRSQVVCLVGNHDTGSSISIKIHGTANDVQALVNDRTRHCPKGSTVLAVMPCQNFNEVKDYFHSSMRDLQVKSQRGWFTITHEQLREYLSKPVTVGVAKMDWILEPTYEQSEHVAAQFQEATKNIHPAELSEYDLFAQ